MASRTNVLVVLSDQQRWDTVECYGSPVFPGLTPELDAMAATGVRFEYAFTPQPVCGPARSCLQTGVYPTESGCFSNNRALPTDRETLADLMSGAGYETAYIGKWHLASDAENDFQTRAVPPERRGGYRDHWLAADILEYTSHGYEGYLYDRDGRRVDFEGYRAESLTGFAVDYLNDYVDRGADRPFFLFLSFVEPHHQNDLGRYIGPIGSKQKFREYNVPGDLVDTDGDWREQLPDYLGCCSSVDRGLGRLRRALDELELAERTLLLYASDHGCHFRTRNTEYKRSAHDASIRVPLIACGPGFDGGGVVRRLVSLIDIPPTILRGAEVEVPSTFRGRPLQTAMDPAADWPEEVFVQVSEDHIARAIRNERWKYSVWAPEGRPWESPGGDRYVEQYLYDLETDPHERRNLVTDPELREVRRELSRRLRQRMQHAGEAPPRIETAPALGT